MYIPQFMSHASFDGMVISQSMNHSRSKLLLA